MLTLSFLGASRIVTGSCYLLETDSHKVLVDCGMFQGSKKEKEFNYGDFPFNPAEIDFLILTHAHIDHSGLIPKLYNQGFKGNVFSTKATAELAAIMLPDSGHIQEMEVERKNRKLARAGKALLSPIYTAADAFNCLKFFQGINYEDTVAISPDIKIRFKDAGHILGSSLVEIWVTVNNEQLKIVFSGDIGNWNQPIINDPSTIDQADYVIMESTYGNRLHENHENKLDKLVGIIKDTMGKGGNLVIPAFAIERTQDLLYDLNKLLEKQVISNLKIAIDSPLAIEATQIFCRSSEYYDPEARAIQAQSGNCPFAIPGLYFARTSEESIALNKVKGTIIISASGMCDAGRIKHHLKHNLWREESTVLFVGYQAKGTLGRRILDGEKTVTIHGEEIAVKASIQKIESYSAHADQDGLLKWIASYQEKPRCLFLTHGEEESSLVLESKINQQFPHIVTVVPHLGERYVLSSNKTFALADKIAFKTA